MTPKRWIETTNAIGIVSKQGRYANTYAYKDIAFENRQYMAVCDTDSYLTHTFGDYMKLPPIEKQVSHHEYIAYWID